MPFDAAGAVKQFSTKHIAVVGDVMLDTWIWGKVTRISPEAPVPVVQLSERRQMLGGAANVARNISSLGAKVTLIGVVGSDSEARTVRDLARGEFGITSQLVPVSNRPTTSKTRISTHAQQIVRVDHESTADVPYDTQATIQQMVLELADADALIVSDYSKGVITQGVMSAVRQWRQKYGKPVLVDPKRSDINLYHGTSLITPNLNELEAINGGAVSTEQEIQNKAFRLAVTNNLDAVMVTMAEAGMMLVTANGLTATVPAHVREVSDVSGAGDTVIAVMSLGMSMGWPLEDCMRVANTAAGISVSKRGTATVSAHELERELKHELENSLDC